MYSRNNCLKRFSSPTPAQAAGFTLLEVLLAMTLAGILGVVLFSTYGMVMDTGKSVRQEVAHREGERIVWTILDADFAGWTFMDTHRGAQKDDLLPPLSREPLQPSSAYLQAIKADPLERSANDTVIVSFASTTSLLEQASDLSAPVCLEYVLRQGQRSAALVRRERAYCGVDGDFPWTEHILLHHVEAFEVALYDAEEHAFITEWKAPVRSEAMPLAVRLTLRRNQDVLREADEESVLIVPLFPWKVSLE